MIQMQFPEIFQTGIVPENANKLGLLAYALEAWGTVQCGNKPTEHFGTVLVEIGDRLGIRTSPDGCSAAFKAWVDAGKPLDFFDNEIYRTPAGGKSKFQLLSEENESLKKAIKDVVAAEIDHNRHGDPYTKLQHCIVLAHKAAFGGVEVTGQPS